MIIIIYFKISKINQIWTIKNRDKLKNKKYLIIKNNKFLKIKIKKIITLKLKIR